MNNETMDLSGKALSIYLYMLLVRRPVGIRELQRKLGFSTPSLVHYHINRLVNAGLVKRVASKYIVNKRIKVGVLKHFVTLGAHLVPRYFFYATFLTTMFILYILLFTPEEITNAYIFSAITMILAVIFAWIETIILWRDLINLVKQQTENKPCCLNNVFS